MTEEKKKTGIIQLVMTGLLVVAAFAVGSMWTELKMLKSGNQPAADEAALAEPGEEETIVLSEGQVAGVLAEPAWIKGDENAPVSLIEFSDYQCPFCKRYVDETLGQIMSEYVETGKVRYVFKDLPLSFHQNAHLAAQAARCAGDQESYEAYHGKLFETQTVWAEETEAVSLFKGYAAGLGLDQTEFNGCLDEGKYEQAVDDDLALAQEIGASGTPTFFINGVNLIGAQPFSAFKAMIDEALGE